MPETESGATAVGLIDRLAAALGYSPTFIEIAIFALFIILLLVCLFAALAIFRIRKEMISLNFKLIYIGRLIEQAVKAPPVPQAAQAQPVRKKTVQEPSEPADGEDKFKL